MSIHQQVNQWSKSYQPLERILAIYSADFYSSIIAVTGLAGHAFGSWKAKGSADMWLRDFLPESVDARILTYGYDSKLPGSQSEASITDLSKRLLESIKTTRSEEDVRIIA